jgi:excisionase family DNA binding protein
MNPGKQPTPDAGRAAPMYTTADLAALFRVSARTVARWAASGRIPAPVRIGRRNRWTASAIQHYLDELA